MEAAHEPESHEGAPEGLGHEPGDKARFFWLTVQTGKKTGRLKFALLSPQAFQSEETPLRQCVASVARGEKPAVLSSKLTLILQDSLLLSVRSVLLMQCGARRESIEIDRELLRFGSDFRCLKGRVVCEVSASLEATKLHNQLLQEEVAFLQTVLEESGSIPRQRQASASRSLSLSPGAGRQEASGGEGGEPVEEEGEVSVSEQQQHSRPMRSGRGPGSRSVSQSEARTASLLTELAESRAQLARLPSLEARIVQLTTELEAQAEFQTEHETEMRRSYQAMAKRAEFAEGYLEGYKLQAENEAENEKTRLEFQLKQCKTEKEGAEAAVFRSGEELKTVRGRVARLAVELGEARSEAVQQDARREQAETKAAEEARASAASVAEANAMVSAMRQGIQIAKQKQRSAEDALQEAKRGHRRVSEVYERRESSSSQLLGALSQFRRESESESTPSTPLQAGGKGTPVQGLKGATHAAEPTPPAAGGLVLQAVSASPSQSSTAATTITTTTTTATTATGVEPRSPDPELARITGSEIEFMLSSHLAEEVALLRQSSDQLGEEIEAIRSEKRGLEDSLVSVEASLKEKHTAQVSLLQGEIDAAKDASLEAMAACSRRSLECEALQEAAEGMRWRLDEANAALGTQMMVTEGLEERLEALEAESEAYHTQEEELEASNGELRREKGSLEAELSELRSLRSKHEWDRKRGQFRVVKASRIPAGSGSCMEQVSPVIHDPEKEGKLFVHPAGAAASSRDRTGFRSHWFVVKASFLYEFTSREDVVLANPVVWLQDAKVDPILNQPNPKLYGRASDKACDKASDAAGPSHGLRILLPTGRELKLYGETREEVCGWIEALRGSNSMDWQHEEEAEQEKSLGVKGKPKPPTWVPDTDVVQCCGCQSQFGLFRRRHHCRRCGLVFCNSCAGRFCACPDIGIPDKVRVCDNCFSVRAFHRSQSQSRSIGPNSPTLSSA